MKKAHIPTLKIHTIFNLVIGVLYLAIIACYPSITLAMSTFFLLLYVAGNGLIHSKKNQLNRDTLLEYIILSVVALIILANAIIK